MTVRVIYIAGQAYSGSTVLCGLLGLHPQMEPVSELSMWTLKAERTQRTCSCGRTRTDCPFWTEVHTHWLEAVAPHTVEDYAALQRRIETISYTWQQMFSRRGWQHPAEMETYRLATVAMFEAAARASGRQIIVDSSKKPGRGVAISRMQGLEVFIIHLVRNGLNFVDSNMRRSKVAPSDPLYLYRVFRLGTKWSASNYAAERALAMNGAAGLRVRFEDLTADPERSLQRIGAAVAVDLSPIQEHVAAGLPIGWRHMESGSRHRVEGPSPLKPGYAAVPKLSRAVQLAFYLGAWPFMRRYGYL